MIEKRFCVRRLGQRRASRGYAVELSNCNHIPLAYLPPGLIRLIGNSLCDQEKLGPLLLRRMRLNLRGITGLILDVQAPDIATVVTQISQKQVVHRIHDGKLCWIPVLQPEEFAPTNAVVLERCCTSRFGGRLFPFPSVKKMLLPRAHGPTRPVKVVDLVLQQLAEGAEMGSHVSSETSGLPQSREIADQGYDGSADKNRDVVR